MSTSTDPDITIFLKTVKDGLLFPGSSTQQKGEYR